MKRKPFNIPVNEENVYKCSSSTKLLTVLQALEYFDHILSLDSCISNISITIYTLTRTMWTTETNLYHFCWLYSLGFLHLLPFYSQMADYLNIHMYNLTLEESSALRPTSTQIYTRKIGSQIYIIYIEM